MRSQLVPALKVRGEREVVEEVKVEAEVKVAAEAGAEQDIPHLTRGRIRSRSSVLNLQLKWRQKKYLQVILLQKRREGEEEVTGRSTEIEELTAAIPARRKTGEEKEKMTTGEKEILLLVLHLHLPSVFLKLRHHHQ